MLSSWPQRCCVTLGICENLRTVLPPDRRLRRGCLSISHRTANDRPLRLIRHQPRRAICRRDMAASIQGDKYICEAQARPTWTPNAGERSTFESFSPHTGDETQRKAERDRTAGSRTGRATGGRAGRTGRTKSERPGTEPGERAKWLGADCWKPHPSPLGSFVGWTLSFGSRQREDESE